MPLIGQTATDPNEEAARADGAPSFVGLNTLDDLGTSPPGGGNAVQWRVGDSIASGAGLDWSAGSDATDAAFPTKRLFDRNPWTFSRPTGASTKRFAVILMDLNQGTDDAHTINFFSHQALNGASFPSGANTLLQFAEDTDPGFTAPLALLVAFLASDVNAKLMSLLISGGDDFTNVRFARIIIDSVTTLGVEPEVNHVVLGKRRQMGHEPMEQGFDEAPLRSRVRDFVADSEADARYVFSKGQAVIPVRFNPTPAGATGLDEVQALRDMFDDTDSGTKKMLYIDEPVATASPTGRHRGHWVKLEEPALFLELLSVNDRIGSFNLVEAPPFQSTEVG